MGLKSIPIEGCVAVRVRANADARGCLFEIFREEWPGAFKTVQWNACASRSRASCNGAARTHTGNVNNKPTRRARAGEIIALAFIFWRSISARGFSAWMLSRPSVVSERSCGVRRLG